MNAEQEMESVRGLEMMDGQKSDEDAKFLVFMNIFHPDHPKTPKSKVEARKMRKNENG